MGDVRLVLDNRDVAFTRGAFFVNTFVGDIEVGDILTKTFVQQFASSSVRIDTFSKFFFYFPRISRYSFFVDVTINNIIV